jgi:predicted aminopeptidase
MKKKGYNKLVISGFIVFFISLLFIPIVGPSTIGYLGQAISGHFRIMLSRVAIQKMLKTKHLDPDTRKKLSMILQIRAYASNELGLPDNGSYTVISQIKEMYPGWNVYCAPKFSLEPCTWCYPIAGCVVYKGYFAKNDAFEFADKMKNMGFDVFVGPFIAYSTLGWYDDPVLTSQLRMDSIQLASLVFHELAHQKIYVSGDSRFNEGFAVSVERSGVLRWLRSLGREDQIIQARRFWNAEDTMVSKILRARSELDKIYHDNLDSSALSYKKDSIFHKLTLSLCNGNCKGVLLPKIYGEEFELNNAYFIPINTYYSLVKEFQYLLDHCGGNFIQFYKKVKVLGKLPIDKRQHEIKSGFISSD